MKLVEEENLEIRFRIGFLLRGSKKTFDVGYPRIIQGVKVCSLILSVLYTKTVSLLYFRRKKEKMKTICLLSEEIDTSIFMTRVCSQMSFSSSSCLFYLSRGDEVQLVPGGQPGDLAQELQGDRIHLRDHRHQPVKGSVKQIQQPFLLKVRYYDLRIVWAWDTPKGPPPPHPVKETVKQILQL